jgi:Myb-like DNA-binding domain
MHMYLLRLLLLCGCNNRTPEEEEMLREGVRQYGEGKWSKVTNCLRHSFQEYFHVNCVLLSLELLLLQATVL